MSVQLGSAYGEIRIGTGDAERSVTSLAESMRNVGSRMSLAISAPLAVIGKKGLQAAMNFETSLNTVRVVSGATEEAMGSLRDRALQLGKDTAFSAGEAAAGMLELAKAGFTAEQSVAAIGGVLDLAAAGGLSVAQAAEISANALNSFNLEASEAGRIADLLAASANSSSIEVTDMAAAFTYAASTFAANGQAAEDLATAIAILGNNGIKGSMAGTALRGSMSRLAAPTTAAKKVLDGLNVSVYNADGSMRSYESIVKDLSAAMGPLTDAQRNQAMVTLFGQEVMGAMNILLNEGVEGWDAMESAVTKSGVAQEVAEAKMKGLSGAIAYAKGTVESTLITAFLPLTETLGDLIRQGADLIAKFAELPQPVINAALAFGAVLAVAGPLLVAIPMIGTVIGALLSPIGLVVVGVAALAAAWAADWGGIQGKAESVINALQPALERLKQYLDMIKGGDWSGLQKAVFSDVSSMLQQASATIQAFDWGDWIDRALDWGSYISTIAWDAFISALEWTSDIVGAVDWASFITALSDWSLAIGTVAWDGFISALTWTSDIVGSVDWAGFITRLSDWGQWIASLDWTKIITTYIDWAMWIPALTWNSFVKMLDWATIVGAFVWSEWLSKLDWSESISTFDWSEWISGALDWTAYVGEFAWNSFVSKLEWPIIAEVIWADYISKLTWESVITSLSDWGAWVSAVSWDAFIGALTWGNEYIQSVDWAAFIAALPDWAAYVKQLAWDGFVAALTWGSEYIQSLDWGAFVATLSDWGQWIASLDWTKIITTAIDWALWIPALQWNLFVKVLDFSTYIYALVWTEFITKIDWGAFIDGTLDWGNQVSKVDWGEWIGGALDWAAYISAFTWDTFVSRLEWPIIAQFAWNEWIVDFEWPTLPAFSWSSWIASFRWPTLPSFSWSSWISSFNWPTLPTVRWADFIPRLSWPSIPSFPGWGAFVSGLNPFGDNAMGTRFWEGGLTWVGERGPELIDLPRGARVYDHTSSKQMAGGEMKVENHYHIYNDLDVESITYKVMQTMRRAAR